MTMYNICARCVMDTTDPEIAFDKNGYCNHCLEVERMLKTEPFRLSAEEKEHRLKELIEHIKLDGRTKKYDCIIGVSGGLDSSFVAYNLKKWNLRPLAVHVDNGWDTEVAVGNIDRIRKELKIDVRDYVLDWDEFRDMQVSFLKSSTTDSEIITDHAVIAVLYEMAAKEGLRHILGGTNLATEAVYPRRWSVGHSDWIYIKGIQKRFGSVSLKSFPHITRLKFYRYKKINKIEWISILDYIDYKKENAKRILAEEIGWEDYGVKHTESLFTKFHFGYILPTKFGYDKRKARLSSMIMSGQITREEALETLKKPLYSPDELEKDRREVIKRLGITPGQFDEYMELPSKTYWDYPSYETSLLSKFLRKVRGSK